MCAGALPLDPRTLASWAFDPNAEEGTGGGPRHAYGRHGDDHAGHLLRNNRHEARAIHNVTQTRGIGVSGEGRGGVGVGGDLVMDLEAVGRAAARAVAHASLTRSKGKVIDAPRGTAGDVHALHTLVGVGPVNMFHHAMLHGESVVMRNAS